MAREQDQFFACLTTFRETLLWERPPVLSSLAASNKSFLLLIFDLVVSFDTHQEGNPVSRASLVAQWLGVCLPMQGARIRALVWEDPTCRGATGPVSHNY
ncbi:hypothetical protein J1605_014970 [Eschrichtius robustus]|uniref:Uncharacterized protein n=1 Tax=Eschrichtius robustus TaxID=9764 RepID=A0AB34GCA1_ESCRO|nr:hypothetical protein J1605_014970 [Eschrichtius robustus]